MDKYIYIIIVIIVIYLFNNNKKDNVLEKFTQIPNGFNNVLLSNENGDIQSIDTISYLDNAIPKGVIVAWSGTTTPNGWRICDGTNNTPDLRGRFILGWSTNNTSGLATNDPQTNITVNEINQKRGKETVKLEIKHIPTHNHDIVGKGDDSGYCATGECTFYSTDRWTNDREVRASKSNGKLVVENTGGDQPHDNMPPYFVLAYIMKI